MPSLKTNTYSKGLCRQHRFLVKATKLVKMILKLLVFIKLSKAIISDCMFSSCQVRISEWIHTLLLPECQGTPCSKQARYLKLFVYELSGCGFESRCSHFIISDFIWLKLVLYSWYLLTFSKVHLFCIFVSSATFAFCINIILKNLTTIKVIGFTMFSATLTYRNH